MAEQSFNKEKLLVKLKENRDEHKRIYLEAVEGYRNSVAYWLEKQRKQLDKVEDANLSTLDLLFRERLPTHHLNAYDNAISMLEWSEDESVVLTLEDFDRYVRDNWEWQRDFLTSTSRYSQGASAKFRTFE